jgi:DNA-binding XRE family transcriptional regulator
MTRCWNPCYAQKHILLACGRKIVGRTLNEYLERSDRARSPGVREARAVFDQSYCVARQIIELRERHQLTQVELSRRTGIPQAQISRIERGVISPTTTTLAKVAEALDADLRLVAR